MDNRYDEGVISRVKIDHSFGVITYHFADGSVMQYTRAMGERMFSPQEGQTATGARAINASVTEEEFNLIVESERKRKCRK